MFTSYNKRPASNEVNIALIVQVYELHLSYIDCYSELTRRLEMADTRHDSEKGKMTVEEAGHKGGERVRELIEEGKQMEEGKGGGHHSSSHSSGQHGQSDSHSSGQGRESSSHSSGEGRESGSHSSGQNRQSDSQGRSGSDNQHEHTRGGSHEQHVKAGQQSHKNS
jgi:hypothetical protein